MKQLTIAGVNVNALTKEDLVEITPDMARKYLQKDNNNIRRVSTTEVNKYAKMLKSDEWHFNGDTIAFDETGRMKDGQHRVHAIHRTGQSLYTFPVLISDDTTIDNKKRLEFEDILNASGYKNARNLASLIKLYYRYVNNYPNYLTSTSIDNNTATNFMLEHGDLLVSFEHVSTLYKKSGVSQSILAFLYHVMKSKDLELANQFIEMIRKPIEYFDEIGIGSYDALYQYKVWLKSTASKESPIIVRAAMIIKAWNCWRTNTPVTKLIWRCVGVDPEEFPTIG